MIAAQPLQAAIYTKLAAASPLMALVSAVYDHVVESATFPYVVIGEDTSIPFDTHSSIGGEYTCTIHTWSRERGQKETKLIQQAVYDALHRQTLTVSGVAFVDCQCEYQESFTDADGITRHGVQRFRILIDES